MNKILKSALFAGLSSFVAAQAATTYGGVTIDEANGKRVAIIDGESTETIEIPEDVVVDSVIYNRAFKNNVPATIMLPFDIDEWRLKNMKCFKYMKVTKNWDGNEYSRAPWVLYITHDYDQVLKANTPYVAIPGADMDALEFDISNNRPTVTLNTTTNTRVDSNSDKYGTWDFVGSYEYKVWNEGDPELGRVYGFAARDIDDIKAGEFVKGAAGIKIRPMRAYLKCAKTNNVLAKAMADASMEEELPETIEVRIMSVDAEGNETASTHFGSMNTRTGDITVDHWVDLKGRKLDHKPTVKGTYYNNHKKVIVK